MNRMGRSILHSLRLKDAGSVIGLHRQVDCQASLISRHLPSGDGRQARGQGRRRDDPRTHGRGHQPGTAPPRCRLNRATNGDRYAPTSADRAAPERTSRAGSLDQRSTRAGGRRACTAMKCAAAAGSCQQAPSCVSPINCVMLVRRRRCHDERVRAESAKRLQPVRERSEY